jgi:cob(I)alamin adenosyltransferase
MLDCGHTTGNHRQFMKIYTKTGDDGTTGLLGGSRISKSDARIECYGLVDELNAAIGWAAVEARGEIVGHLQAVQSDLFVIGSLLAVADGAAAPASLPPLEEAHVARLEMQIDTAVARLPALRNFILPGGCELAARLHMTRTICRRAERRLVQFSQDRPILPVILTYLNRLSDWLFVQARVANEVNGVDDVIWTAQSR